MEQSHLARFIHGFTAGVNLKLAVNLLDMSGHRVRRDRQNLADFIEAHTLCEKMQDFRFAGGKGARLGVRNNAIAGRVILQRAEHASRDRRADRRSAASQQPDLTGDIFAIGFFQDVAGSTRLNRSP